MIEIKNLNLAFEDKKLYNNFNLRVKKGEKILLSSPSGSGKTTLFKILTGLIVPDSGSIIIDNTPLSRSSISKLRSKIFYLDQDISLPSGSVSEYIEVLNSYKGNKISRELLIDTLNTLNLDKNILEKEIKELSGGERQRLALSIGLILNRPIWFLDEPTSALDKKLKQKVADILIKQKITLLVISHDENWSCINGN